MDPVTHALIPALILLALNTNSKKVFSLLPLAIFPDLDSFFGLWAHRVVFHNFLFVLLIPLAFFLYVRKYYPKKLEYIYIGWFFLISHLILDLQGGFSFFWPISRKAPYISPELSVDMTGSFPRFILDVDYGLASSSPEFTGGYLIASSTFLILFLIIFSAVINREQVISFIEDFTDFLLEKLYGFFE